MIDRLSHQIHVVHFDHDQKISQIRMYWDQAALLKDLDVIGARGKNWPIHAGKEQARLVELATAAATVATAASTSGSRPSSVGGAEADKQRTESPHKRTFQDPHTSLSLFNSVEPSSETPRPVTAPMRSPTKPPSRDYHELFAGDEPDTLQASTSNAGPFAGDPQSTKKTLPSKGGSGKSYQPSRLFEDGSQDEKAMPSKSGHGKNYQPSRLFDVSDAPGPRNMTSKSGSGKNYQPSRLFEDNDKKDKNDEGFIKPDAKKYHHFDLGGGSDENDKTVKKPSLSSPTKARASKHISQWNFEDFVTPEKVAHKVRGQDARHFGWSDDEVNLDTPAQPKRVVQPRRDAETHFEFKDDGTPLAGNENKRLAMRGKGSTHNDGLGLYQNNICREDEATPTSPVKRLGHGHGHGKGDGSKEMDIPILGNITNVNNHRKNFASQFDMVDDSPLASPNHSSITTNTVGENGARNINKKKTMTQDRKAAVRMMDSHWDRYDDDDGDDEQKKEDVKRENVNPNENRPDHDRDGEQQQEKKKRFSTGLKTTGNGMGGRTGIRRQWGIGNESADEDEYGDGLHPYPSSSYQHGRRSQQQNDKEEDHGDLSSITSQRHSRRGTTASSSSTNTTGKSFWDF